MTEEEHDAKLRAEAQALREERDRIERNRDMWKGQCERQAEKLEALRARFVVPDGYALVPVEPTREMFIAVNKEDDKAYAGGCDHGAQFDWLWDAALEAAPRLNGRAVSEGLLRSACSSITRLILSAQTRPSCQKGMVDPCRCHRCNVDRALKVDAELRALLSEQA
ncbi:hypothetical protein [Pseudomonas aeruginosa]|uniref:hypothetical protein n=1 Tax=Pseudomonas aeruginosa TaxID=287 RepID=UPI0021F20FD2|nr:hypothetical protein [Pseudomonas aeruginosa]MCV4056876.1 hypothetical protein [Pseudomonas aeruginosa]MCV4070924.1 hypothetical protein [Pseudomonas aeruginosa]MCV4109726.1 hypothetical protein [Pseudomonas aeruginosa]MCV4149260.1 hypothetical protein [Pseudomonas aeruginosa]